MTKFMVPEEKAVTVGTQGSKWQALPRRRKQREVVGVAHKLEVGRTFHSQRHIPYSSPMSITNWGLLIRIVKSRVHFSFQPPQGDTETNEPSPHPQGPYRMAELLCSLHTK